MLISDLEAGELAGFFKIIGDPTRVRIIFALKNEERSVGELSALLELSLSAISHQLRLLKAHRIVKNRKEGTQVFYSLDDDHVYELICQGYEHIAHI